MATVTGTNSANKIINTWPGRVINSAESIFGLAGNDLIIGYGGKDTIDGGTGIDMVDYSYTSSPITVTLNGAVLANVKVGTVFEDKIKNIENVTGGSGADILTGLWQSRTGLSRETLINGSLPVSASTACREADDLRSQDHEATVQPFF